MVGLFLYVGEKPSTYGLLSRLFALPSNCARCYAVQKAFIWENGVFD